MISDEDFKRMEREGDDGWNRQKKMGSFNMKMELLTKNVLKELREVPDSLYMQESFVGRGGISNGDALCSTQYGGGKQVLGYAFAGSIVEPVKQFQDTVEYKAKPEWSNGTNTANAEARLRKHKHLLGWGEPRMRKGGRRPRRKSNISIEENKDVRRN